MLEKRRIYLPPLSLVGPGVIVDLVEEIKDQDGKKVLVVTDKVLNELGVVGKITDLMDQKSINYVVFDEVKPNPTCANVNAGLKVFKENNCDFILTIGGGSPQDCDSGNSFADCEHWEERILSVS